MLVMSGAVLLDFLSGELEYSLKAQATFKNEC